MISRASCSFCCTPETKKKPLIQGQGAYICKECASDVLETPVPLQNKKGELFKRPHEIKEHLDEYIVGQEDAKRILSVSVYNHYKRIEQENESTLLKKSNILLMGPSGTGKTHLVQTLAKLLDVPFVIGDATTLTQAGYVGEDVESLLERLMISAGQDVKKAERGIIYIDEIDKVAEVGSSTKAGAGGRALQANLLKMIEGYEVSVPGKTKHMPSTMISTQNILFILGGAFVSLWKKDETTRRVGFMETNEEKKSEDKQEVTVSKLVEFGMLPELIGRVPVMAKLEDLTKENLEHIFTKPKDCLLKEYQYLLALDGVKLTFTDDAVHHIATEAIDKGVGARGLRGIIERQMLDIMYEVPKLLASEAFTTPHIRITKDVLTKDISWRDQISQEREENEI